MVDSNVFSTGRLEERSTAFTPVNTALITSAANVEDENFKIGNEPVGTLEIVAKIRNYVNGTMKVEFELYDEFGKVDAIVYKKTSEEPRQLKGFQYVDNGYVHCFGQLRRFYTTTSFVISGIKNVRLYSEVVGHRVKVMWAALYRKGYLARAENIASPPIAERRNYDNFSMPDQATLISSLHPDQQKVLQTIMNLRDRCSRTDRDSIYDGLPAKMAISSFENALMKLTETGFVYKDDDSGTYFLS